MERIRSLIDKLQQQNQQNCNPAQLLLTVQLLQSELVKMQQRNGSRGPSKVAVTLPSHLNYAEQPAEPETASVTEQVEEVQVGRRESLAAIEAPVVEIPKEYRLQKPEPEPKENGFEPAPLPAVKEPVAGPVAAPAYSTAASIPTITQHLPSKELHEVIAEKRQSLNDQLNERKTELAHVLKESPIRDLRKAIGINDRFSFVNELFRGDEAMYERSIKTINGFHILSEAEYWINRELKFKLGWNDNTEMVQHFYHLVRRRFS